MNFEPRKKREASLEKARRIVHYMNNIRFIDPSFHKELKFIRDEQTKVFNHTDYLKVSQVIKHLLQFS